MYCSVDGSAPGTTLKYGQPFELELVGDTGSDPVSYIHSLCTVCIRSLRVRVPDTLTLRLRGRAARAGGRQREHRDGDEENAPHRRERRAPESGGGGERREGGVGGLARVRDALRGGARGPAVAHGVRGDAGPGQRAAPRDAHEEQPAPGRRGPAAPVGEYKILWTTITECEKSRLRDYLWSTSAH